ncbi:subtilisin-like protein [Dacryopinax primogenitus]|uniref:tripeptidyl-peptidase II n=1 Tax=Dacryopinax primogenitus (strain DJM 731) TaxID=1858805 RepID=M5G4V7_DACPD|nr:subtilisin-like protein [Dacryopinax primogenitus]EJT98782.1 subtilisin-like protein [Dacryopinax primogenitus]
MRSLYTLLLSLAALSAAALQPRAGYACKDRSAAPGWHNLGPARPDRTLTLEIAFKHNDFAGLHEQLLLRSDPESGMYGRHMSKEEVEAFLRPGEETRDAVLGWLEEYGLGEESVRWSPAGDWAFVTVIVEKANRLLDTEYSVWHKDGHTILRSGAYSLPHELFAHIDTIQPTTDFSIMRKHGALPMSDEDVTAIEYNAAATEWGTCNTTVTIKCLQKLYKTEGYVPRAVEVNRLGVAAYLGDDANLDDLNEFLSLQRPQAVGHANFTTVPIANGTNPQTNLSGTTESALDIQFTTGLTWPTKITFFETGGTRPHLYDAANQTGNANFLSWLTYVSALPDEELPSTFSTSYGSEEVTVPIDYAQRVCAGLAALTARGVSLMYSSGDSGVGYASANFCVNPNDLSQKMFLPNFPASCPYVTSVGGTQNIPNEVAVTRFGSGGGFSNFFARPAYQEAAVSRYLSWLGSDLEGWYNASGRGFPDVAAQGDRFQIVAPAYLTVKSSNGTKVGLVGGTSASSPTFASVVALLNDVRRSQGKPPLGFLNPLLYRRLYLGLNDITVGSSFGCNTTGFPATYGWDPVTGLGTPDFEKLVALLEFI